MLDDVCLCWMCNVACVFSYGVCFMCIVASVILYGVCYMKCRGVCKVDCVVCKVSV